MGPDHTIHSDRFVKWKSSSINQICFASSYAKKKKKRTVRTHKIVQGENEVKGESKLNTQKSNPLKKKERNQYWCRKLKK